MRTPHVHARLTRFETRQVCCTLLCLSRGSSLSGSHTVTLTLKCLAPYSVTDRAAQIKHLWCASASKHTRVLRSIGTIAVPGESRLFACTNAPLLHLLQSRLVCLFVSCSLMYLQATLAKVMHHDTHMLTLRSTSTTFGAHDN